eukprot:9488241-Pyramimonas_sp.AAC.1
MRVPPPCLGSLRFAEQLGSRGRELHALRRKDRREEERRGPHRYAEPPCPSAPGGPRSLQAGRQLEGVPEPVT